MEREISLSFGTFGLALCMLTQQCSMANDVDRLADQGDATLCIEAAKAGVNLKGKLREACDRRVEKRP